MLFCSLKFFYFFLIVFCVYWIIPWRLARTFILLVASFYFYASWNKWLALIICVSTFIDYLLALGIEAWEDPRLRKSFSSLSVVGKHGLLVYFQYPTFAFHY